MMNTIAAYLYKYITIPRRIQSRMMSMMKFRLDLICRGNKNCNSIETCILKIFTERRVQLILSITSLRVFFSLTLVFLTSAAALSTCIIRPHFYMHSWQYYSAKTSYLSIYLNREKQDWINIYFTLLSISSISGTCRSISWR